MTNSSRRDVVVTTRVALEHSRLSRRTLLRRGGAAALGLGLDADSSRSLRRRDDGEAAAPEASGTIDYLSWEGYDIPDPMKAWKTANCGRREVDVHREPRRHPGEDQGRRRRVRPDHVLPGLQAALHRARDPHRRSTPTRSRTSRACSRSSRRPTRATSGSRTTARGQAFRGPGARSASPGTTRSCPGGLSSWYDLLDPKFKGKVGVINDPLGAFTLTAHILGKDPSALPKEEYSRDRATSSRRWSARRRALLPSFGDMTKASSSPARSSSATRAGRTRTTSPRRRRERQREDEDAEGGRVLLLRPLRDPVDDGQRATRCTPGSTRRSARAERSHRRVPRRRRDRRGRGRR